MVSSCVQNATRLMKKIFCYMLRDFVHNSWTEVILLPLLEMLKLEQFPEIGTLFTSSRSELVPTRVNWALDYSPRSMAISNIVRKYWHLISDTSGCELPPMIGYHKTKSLRSILAHSNVTSNIKSDLITITGHHKCGQCNICSLTTSSKEIHFPDKGFSHKLTSFSNCKTRICVYLLECFCGKRYIGSTRCQLHVRIQEHISRIKHHVHEAPLVQHFISQQHEPSDFRVVVLEVI